MNVVATRIPEVLILEPKVFGDERGFFMETWNQKAFNEAVGREIHFVQDNHSRSSKGVLRGLHYQIKQPQGKLVRVSLGEVFDVAVDLRKSSPTFGHWVGEYLSAENKRMLWVPPGFGHGFYVTSETAEFQYKCTDYYRPEYERSILWNDSDIGVSWPITDSPNLSAKDRNGLPFRNSEIYS